MNLDTGREQTDKQNKKHNITQKTKITRTDELEYSNELINTFLKMMRTKHRYHIQNAKRVFGITFIYVRSKLFESEMI